MSRSFETMPAACRRIQALAERDPRRALPLAQHALETFPTDEPLLRAWAEYTLGWVLLCWERFDNARAHVEAARARFESCGARREALQCELALLIGDLLQTARPKLEQDLAALAERFAQIGAARKAARCRMYLAALYNIQGRPREAEAVLTSITPTIGRGDTLDRARWLRIRAATATWLDDYPSAIALLAEAERIFARHGHRIDMAKCWAEAAWRALRQEQLDQALAYYQRAERVFTQLDLPLRRAICAKESGLLFLRSGRYDLALQRILIAKEYFTSSGRARDIAGCELQLGNLYFYIGGLPAALACYERAEALYRSAGVHGESLIARRNIALVYRAQGNFAQARALLADIEVQAQAHGNRAELAEVWMEQAGLLAEDQRFDAAVVRYQQARDLFLGLDNLLDVAECETELGWLNLRNGEQTAAWTFFRAAAPVVAPHPYYQWRNEYGLARCAELRGHATQALEHYQAALAIVAQLRGQLSSEAGSSGLFAQAARLHADALRLAAARGEVELALAISEGQRALVLQRTLATRRENLPADYRAAHDRLRAEIETLVSQAPDQRAANAALDAALAAYGELLLQARHRLSETSQLQDSPRAPFALERARALLNSAYGNSWTTLVYVWSDEAILVMSVTPGDLAIERIPYDVELQNLIVRATDSTYRRHTYRDLPYLQGQTSRRWQTLSRLGERLLPRAARARIGPNHRLLIVPAGPLHALPWGALRLDERWLAEQAVVQLTPSLAIWQALAARPTRASGRTALLVGCGEFEERAPALPAVAAELAAVSACWDGDVIYLRDEQATRTALLSLAEAGDLEQIGLLHIATHARMLPAYGLAAHVKLCDGDLLLPEIARLRLAGALVVLSTCDGAAADALPGEELLSLSWALLAAGASGVLASLWLIDDRAAQRVTAAFYDALRQHRDAGAALAQAQRALIAEEDALEPDCWGSFVLTGPGYNPQS